eukprot:TRINITY_DN11248_c0_g1_i1.p1 TRINITY_DN11248_c0_g1~~TRINITY_DN11248_c0_g1_i1.p1  ORF type:complete len:767 (+),score=127.98 TRINITY_DN11248_c0_g1_i1:235-2535(+)
MLNANSKSKPKSKLTKVATNPWTIAASLNKSKKGPSSSGMGAQSPKVVPVARDLPGNSPSNIDRPGILNEKTPIFDLTKNDEVPSGDVSTTAIYISKTSERVKSDIPLYEKIQISPECIKQLCENDVDLEVLQEQHALGRLHQVIVKDLKLSMKDYIRLRDYFDSPGKRKIDQLSVSTPSQSDKRLKSTDPQSVSSDDNCEYPHRDRVSEAYMTQIPDLVKAYTNDGSPFDDTEKCDMREYLDIPATSTMSKTAKDLASALSGDSWGSIKIAQQVRFVGQFMKFVKEISGETPQIEHLWNIEFVSAYIIFTIMLYRQKKIVAKTVVDKTYSLARIITVMFPQRVLKEVNDSARKAIRFSQNAFESTSRNYANVHPADRVTYESLGKDLSHKEVTLLYEASIWLIVQLDIWCTHAPNQVTIESLLLGQAAMMFCLQTVPDLSMQMVRDLRNQDLYYDPDRKSYMVEVVWRYWQCKICYIPKTPGRLLSIWIQRLRPFLSKLIPDEDRPLESLYMMWFNYSGKEWVSGAANPWTMKWMNMVLPQSVLTMNDIHKAISNLAFVLQSPLGESEKSTMLEELSLNLAADRTVQSAVKTMINRPVSGYLRRSVHNCPVPSKVPSISELPRDSLSPWFPHYFLTSCECFYAIEMRRTFVWHYNVDVESCRTDSTDNILDQYHRHAANRSDDSKPINRLLNCFGVGSWPREVPFEVDVFWSRPTVLSSHLKEEDLDSVCFASQFKDVTFWIEETRSEETIEPEESISADIDGSR